MADLWTRLQQILSENVNEDFASRAANRLRESQAANPRVTLSDFGFGPQHGLNVVASPGMYYPPRMKQNTKLEDLGYSTGGEFSMLGGVKLNPNSQFDPTASSTHEAQHYKEAFSPANSRTSMRPYGTKQEKEQVEQNRKQDEDILKNITNRLYEYRASQPSNLRNYRILSGQSSSDEITPQLRSYESMLPAGMSLFQSPLGKALFKTPEEKLWYINKIQPSMTDQRYLEDIIDRAEKLKKLESK